MRILLVLVALIMFHPMALEAASPAAAAAVTPQTPVSAPQTAPAPPPDNSTESDETKQEARLERRLLEQEAAHLRKQLESVEEYHESVLATSYFALGTVFTITLLLLGYSWWFNTRAYEVDKANLRDEVAAKIEAAEGRISLKEQEQRSAAEVAANARIDSINTNLSAGLSQLRTELGELRTSTVKLVNSSSRKLDWLFKEFRIIEEMVWAQSGAYQNALLSLAQAIEMCADDEDESMLDVLVRRFERRVDEMSSAGKRIGPDLTAMIRNNLTKSLAMRPEKTQRVLDQLARVSESGAG